MYAPAFDLSKQIAEGARDRRARAGGAAAAGLMTIPTAELGKSCVDGCEFHFLIFPRENWRRRIGASAKFFSDRPQAVPLDWRRQVSALDPASDPASAAVDLALDRFGFLPSMLLSKNRPASRTVDVSRDRRLGIVGIAVRS